MNDEDSSLNKFNYDSEYFKNNQNNNEIDCDSENNQNINDEIIKNTILNEKNSKDENNNINSDDDEETFYKTKNSFDENNHQRKIKNEININIKNEKKFKITKKIFKNEKQIKIFKKYNEEKKLNSNFSKFVIKYVNKFVKDKFNNVNDYFFNVNGNLENKTKKEFLKDIFNGSIENFILKKGVSKNFYKNNEKNKNKNLNENHNKNLLEKLKNENEKNYNNFFKEIKIKEIFKKSLKNIEKNYKLKENNYLKETKNFIENYLKYLKIEI